MKPLLFLSILVMAFSTYSQSSDESNDQDSDEFTPEEFDNTTEAFDENSHIMFGPIMKYKNKGDTFLTNEAERSIIDARLTETFNLWQTKGKRNSHARVAIYGDVNFRLSKSDNSSPMTPPNNKLGLRVDNVISLANSNNGATHFLLRMDLVHFSNGQDPNSRVENLPVPRNDYANGDFSTNYIELAYGIRDFVNNLKNKMNSANGEAPLSYFYSTSMLYVQKHGEGIVWSKVLNFYPGDGTYGKWRLGYRSTVPATITNGKILLSNKFTLETVLGKNEGDRSLANDQGVQLYQRKIRNFNFTYQLITHLRNRKWGLMFFYHNGSDYLNIRYDLNSRIYGFGFILGQGLFVLP